MSGVGAILTAILLSGSTPPAASSGEPMDCGGFAPADLACEDGPEVLTREWADVTVHVFGYVGRVTLELYQTGQLRMHMACEVLAVPEPGDCGPRTGTLVVGLPTWLRCTADETKDGTPSGAGPAGPWGCSARV